MLLTNRVFYGLKVTALESYSVAIQYDGAQFSLLLAAPKKNKTDLQKV